MYQQQKYERIRYMNYKELLKTLRSRKDINKYKKVFKDLQFSCLYIKEALVSYENIPQAKNDTRLIIEVKKLKNDVENNLTCIKTLSEFFTDD